MMELLQRVFRTGKPSGKPIDYETSKDLVASKDIATRRQVAENAGARPEVLYYLANDADPRVRAAVAANEATPVQADLLLARDRDAAVRTDLARKIARLAPGLPAEAHDRLKQMTCEVLEILVRDQVTRVRQLIAEALKDVADAPTGIIQVLARDCEIAVAGPILEFSPLLGDEDLLEIIAKGPIPGALTAIARRSAVREPVAEAISHSADADAIAALLCNPSAQIREETLDRLVERAPGIAAWHRPLVLRAHLPPGVARKLARFIAANLLTLLVDRRDLDPATAREVATIAMRRLDGEEGAEGSPATAKPGGRPAAAEAFARAQRIRAEGRLDEAMVVKAIGDDRAFARAALAVLAELPLEVIDRVLSAHSPKGVTALAWKCGLGARAAVKLQLQLGQISPSAALQPRGDGGYPLSAEAMRWQLDFFLGMGRNG